MSKILSKFEAAVRLASKTFPLAVLVAILFCLPSLAAACPTCKDGLHGNYLAAAFGASVLFMMAMPFLIMSAWIVLIVKSRQAAEQTDLAIVEPSK